MFICPEESNFNYTYAEQIGFEGEDAYLFGKVYNLTDKLPWVGNTSQKWDQIRNLLYPEQNFGIVIDDENITIKKVVGMMPYPICYELENFGHKIQFILDRPCRIIFTNPNSQLYHRMGSNILRGDGIPVNAHTGKSGTQTYYKLKTTMLEKSEEKFGCTAKLDFNYAECVNGELKKNLMNLLGCIPLWLISMTRSTSDLKCPETLNMESKIDADFIKGKLKLFIEQTNYQAEVELESGNACKVPCSQLEIYARKASHFKGSWKNHWFNLHFEVMADVHKEVSNYDKFSLVVEIGSSLGLWIGLSALAVFDIVIKFLETRLRTMSNRLKTASCNCVV